MKLVRGVILAGFAVASVFGQTGPARPEFEVAAVKPSPPPVSGQVNIGVHLDGAQLRCSFLSLKDYLRIAYRVKLYQVTGPEWLATEKFDISAKLPDGVPREQVPDMLQTLLTDRFQIQMHRETKDFPVYAIVLGKGGLTMKETPPDAAGDSADAASKANVNVTASGGRGGTTVDLGKGSYFNFGDNKFEAKKLTMASLADMLARFVDRPVVDMTALTGNYDFTLEFSPEDFRAMQIRGAIAAGVALPPEAMRALDVAPGDSLFTAIQTLGLKLESRKAPLEVLVIDHATKTPGGN
jgi:uncharacterized protein (TIGR03435 family)